MYFKIKLVLSTGADGHHLSPRAGTGGCSAVPLQLVCLRNLSGKNLDFSAGEAEADGFLKA